jgi:hypothetical protein
MKTATMELPIAVSRGNVKGVDDGGGDRVRDEVAERMGEAPEAVGRGRVQGASSESRRRPLAAARCQVLRRV